jgi:thiol-disulfide isomerase/thioredoxin
MELIGLFRGVRRTFGRIPQSATFRRQRILPLIAALILNTSPHRAVCDSLKIIQTHQGEPRPAENDAVAMIETRFKKETDKYDKAFDDFQKSMALDQPFHYDLSALDEFLQSQMTSASDPAARQTAAVFLAELTGYGVPLSSSLHKQIWHVVPPDSDAWSKEDEAIVYESEGLDPEDARTFLQEIVSHNPNRHVQARAQTALVKLASRQHDPETYKFAYAKLEQYKDLKETKVDILLLNPQGKIVPGKAAPIFHLPAIDHNGEITNQTLSGKWYLLDFWATWCGPCLGERAALQEAYYKFKSKSFTIVSISLDESPDKVVSFRKSRWSMPWRHAFLPQGTTSQTAQDYEVDRIGLPRLVLVGPDGKVAAVQPDLGPELIDHTLGYYLGSPSGRPMTQKTHQHPPGNPVN